jgi:hypothetical protein
MPLEINEIGIRMHVRDSTAGPMVASKSDGAEVACSGDERGERPGGRDDMIEECVRRVLRALKNLQER